MSASSLASLYLTFDGVRLEVQRRIEVPLSIRLDRLYKLGHAEPDYGHGPFDARKMRLADMLEGPSALTLLHP